METNFGSHRQGNFVQNKRNKFFNIKVHSSRIIEPLTPHKDFIYPKQIAIFLII